MSNTVFNNRPLIPNANQYFLEKKYISIHSEDIDPTKYPNTSDFEIFLPQEYLNVASARLYSWSFPANYNVFSVTQFNVTMSFQFTTLYNPGEHGVSNVLTEGIFAALNYYGANNIAVEIETGFYNPDQMATELSNKFNDAVTTLILAFFNSPAGAPYAAAKALFTSYDRFHVVYNAVAQKMWFGNTADNFYLANSAVALSEKFAVDSKCIRRNMLPEWANWGLPAYIGFNRCNAPAYDGEEFIAAFPTEGAVYVTNYDGHLVPRFSYGDAIPGSGDDGYWLLPTLPGATVYFLQAPLKIAFMGPSYIYMEIEGMNCIDETSPYNLSQYTLHNSNNNGVVNSAFAKIPVSATPISQYFDNDMAPYKYWNPPAERLKRLKIKFRYHNGMIVDFGLFDYSFMLEFNLLKPQQERSYSIVNAYDLSQNQSYASTFV